MERCNVKAKSIILTMGLFILFCALAHPAAAVSIVGSKHDFATAATSTRPFAEVFFAPDPSGFPAVIDQVCVFCHTPHGAATGLEAPLWNRTNYPPAGYTYKMYTSASFTQSMPTAPTGVSALCMSCHDGVSSVAVGTLINPPGDAQPGDITTTLTTGAIGDIYYVLPNGFTFQGWKANIGNRYQGDGFTEIDMSNDHPVSFIYPVKAGLHPASSIDSRLRLFGPGKNKIECATCHLVHDNAYPPFLSMPNTGSGMCTECHDK